MVWVIVGLLVLALVFGFVVAAVAVARGYVENEDCCPVCDDGEDYMDEEDNG